MKRYGVLKQDKLIKKTITNKKKLINPVYTLYYLNNATSSSFFTVVVSKKISKLAVIRNKIKRQVKMMIRTNQKWFIEGLNIVIVIKQDYLKNDFLANSKSLNSLFRKLGGIVSVQHK